MASAEHQLRIGDRVRVLDQNPAGNPRTPPYILGKRGVVTVLHGAIDNPTDHRGAYPLCTVEFEVGAVFGGSSTDALMVDLHEDWLARA
jgi:nitrile hydratase beta subunit-like protein